MSIRNIAQDLYKAQKKVEQLEAEIKQLDLPASDRSRLEKELEIAKKERDKLKALLDKAKQG